MTKFNSLFVTLAFVIVFFSSITLAAFNVSDVPLDTRATWCQNQISSCVNLCNDAGNNVADNGNDCDPDTLNYHCICTNGYTPNATEYTQTVPYFICSYTEYQCNADCSTSSGGDPCYNGCQMNCSATDPKKYNQTNSTSTFGNNPSSSSPSSTPQETFNSSATDTAINASFMIFLTAFILMFSRL